MRSVLMLLCLLSVALTDTAYGGLAVREYFEKDGDFYARETPVSKSFWPEFGKDFRGNVYARVDVVREYKLDGDKWVVSGVPKDAEKVDPKTLKDHEKKPDETARFIGERWTGTTYVHLDGLSEKDLAALWKEGTLSAEYKPVLVKDPPEVVYFRLSDEEGRDANATPGNLKLAEAIKRCAFPEKKGKAKKDEAKKKGKNEAGASSDSVAKTDG